MNENNKNIDAIFDLLDTLLASNKVEYSAYSALHDQISFLSDSLKEQEPENVLSMEHNRYFPGYYDLTGNCPGCHKYIEQLTNRHYCGYCGKGLIWDE